MNAGLLYCRVSPTFSVNLSKDKKLATTVRKKWKDQLFFFYWLAAVVCCCWHPHWLSHCSYVRKPGRCRSHLPPPPPPCTWPENCHSSKMVKASLNECCSTSTSNRLGFPTEFITCNRSHCIKIFTLRSRRIQRWDSCQVFTSEICQQLWRVVGSPEEIIVT